MNSVVEPLGLRERVWGSGFGVQGLAFRVYGLRIGFPQQDGFARKAV